MSDSDDAKAAHRDQRLLTDPIAWLGTVRPDGRPHFVPIWFQWDGETVLFFSKPDDQKLRNLRQNPRVFLALDDTNHGADVVLLEGMAELLDQPASEVVTEGYLEKYAADIPQLGLTPASMTETYSQAVRVRPSRVFGW